MLLLIPVELRFHIISFITLLNIKIFQYLIFKYKI